MRQTARYLLTAAVVLAAGLALGYRYLDYLRNPWTRDGQVRAQVIQVTPRVSGPIVDLPVVDNQRVSKGDLLFEIDPRTFAAGLAQARANLDKTRNDIVALEKKVESAEAAVAQFDAQVRAAEATITRTKAELKRTKVDVERAAELLKKGNVAKRRYDQAVADYESAVSGQANAEAMVNEARAEKLRGEADLAQAIADLGASGEQNARLRAAKAAVRSAELNLEFTEVRASVDGYVTNLNLRLGSQAVANQPALALIDTNSFWVHGFFRETVVGKVAPGNAAVVTLMSYPDTPLSGRVDSIGWGIAQADGSTGQDLLPDISPTFEWIRLAQRVPVRVHITAVPENVKLRVGTTASVLVKTGTRASDGMNSTPAAPKALQ
jgi:multidrug resistance efflux pump